MLVHNSVKWGHGLLLIFWEKNIGGNDGHEHTQLEYVKSLSKGRELTVLPTSQLGDTNSTKLDALASRRDHRKRPDWSLKNDFSLVASLLTTSGYAELIPVVVPTAQTHEIKVCLQLLKQCPGLARFHLRILLEREIAALCPKERTALQGYILQGSITLSTETLSMVKRLKDRYDLATTSNFILPCTISPKAKELEQGCNNNNTKTFFKVGYLGGTRKEKGSAKIPGIIKNLNRLLVESESGIQVEVHMQRTHKKRRVFRNKYHNHRLAKYNGKPLNAATPLSLVQHPDSLPKEEFNTLLCDSNVILVPYELEAYKCRGSGIVIDAVLAQKPIVYTSGMGMSEFLNFGNAEGASSEKEYAAKLFQILECYDEYHTNTAAAHDKLLDEIQRTSDFLVSL